MPNDNSYLYYKSHIKESENTKYIQEGKEKPRSIAAL